MNSKIFILIITICAVLTLAAFLLLNTPAVTDPLPKIEDTDIASIHVFVFPDISENSGTVCNRTQIQSFVIAYSQESYYRDDVGTTHPLQAIVTFFDGKTMYVNGGGRQGFCTVVFPDGSAHNTTSRALLRWFGQFKR